MRLPSRLTSLALLVATSLSALPALAFPLGVSDPVGASAASLSDSQRQELFPQVQPLLEALGLTHVRLAFSEGDTPFTWGSLADATAQKALYTLDDLIEALHEAGAEVTLVLSARNDADHLADTFEPADEAAWKAFVKLIVERYDGDLDFAVNGCEGPYPNIDKSEGGCSPYDYRTAPDSLRQAWADRHVVRNFQVEDAPFQQTKASGATPESYASLFALTAPLVRALVPADLGVRVIFGGVRPDPSFKPAFVQAMQAARAVEGGAPDAVDLHLVVDEGAFPTGEAYEAGLAEFKLWLSAAGAPSTPIVIGRLRASALAGSGLPWVPGQAPRGTCRGTFCSERGQVESLVKGLVRLGARLDAPVFLSPLLEFIGAGGAADGLAGAGLVTASGDSLVTGATFTARPAFATLRWLGARLPELSPATLTPTFPLPANAQAFRAQGEDGPVWIAWYDWEKEVPAGKDYAGLGKRLTIVDVDAPAVRVWHLDPAAAAAGDPLQVTADFPSQLVAVSSGSVTLDLGQDILLIEPSDEVVGAPDGSGDTIEAPDGASDDALAAEGEDGGGGGGCALGAATTPAPGLLTLLLLALLRRRRG